MPGFPVDGHIYVYIYIWQASRVSETSIGGGQCMYGYVILCMDGWYRYPVPSFF